MSMFAFLRRMSIARRFWSQEVGDRNYCIIDLEHREDKHLLRCLVFEDILSHVIIVVKVMMMTLSKFIYTPTYLPNSPFLPLVLLWEEVKPFFFFFWYGNTKDPG